jgi:TM2 domain-containing membrane protein YozV
MAQKVWVIDAPSMQKTPERIRRNDPSSERKQADSRPLSAASGKSPALSFSLSMVVWGSGDLYIGAYRPGSIFLAAMLFFYAPLFAMVFFRDAASLFVDRIGLPAAVLAAGGGIYLLAGLVCWLANAVGAYYRTIRLRTEVFRGVDNVLCPLCGSILFPGWGQFLNGQPIKGLFFLLCGVAGIFAALVLAVTCFLWPGVEADPAGPAFEICLVAASAFFPLSLLMWIFSAYDSLISWKELSIEKQRRPSTGRRVRQRRFLKNLVPRWTAILALLLALSVGYQWVPAGYYRHALEKIRIETKNRNMVLIPELITRAIDFMDGQGENRLSFFSAERKAGQGGD